jgi:hypothetical protein
MKKAINVKL